MPKATGYSRTQIAIHWGIVALLVVSYFSSDAMKAAWRALRKGGDAFGLTAAAHVWVGVAILALAMLRLVIRRRRGAPALPAGGHPIADLAAKLTHLGLYLLLVAMPVLGLLAWFGGIKEAGEVHEAVFNLLVALVGLHVLGAIYHQFVLRDGLMERMRRPG
ncbi:MAG: cytochrome b/b6 domain-containing protein [Rhodobacteraceae bacterium]|nr:cytochrome b/b6 domain-containing protein [Paracoccaceae bacterium]